MKNHGEFLSSNFEKIIDLLKIEGKNGLAKLQLQKKIHPQIVLNNMINDDNYFLSVVDLWLLFKNIGMSVVFISSFNIKIMNEDHKHNFTGNIVDDNITFIIVPGLGENKIPTFKYISKDDSVFIEKDKVVCNIDEPINFADFLFDYKIESRTEYKKQKPKFTIIDEPERSKPKFKIIDEPKLLEKSKPKPRAKPKIIDQPEEPLEKPEPKPRAKPKIIDQPEEPIKKPEPKPKPKPKFKIIE